LRDLNPAAAVNGNHLANFAAREDQGIPEQHWIAPGGGMPSATPQQTNGEQADTRRLERSGRCHPRKIYSKLLLGFTK
jgi:hypothetical protein